MDRNELTLAIVAALMLAVLLGWALRALTGRLNAGPRSVARTADLAARLHDAEDAREAADRRVAEVEADLGHRLEQTRADLQAALQSLERARKQADEFRVAYLALKAGRDVKLR